ncbi:hypothetical protein GGS21DRAFT_490323 [Xylaria nigripes]|nr:hypothetical protein GGS21DRAFT_490323 [Xylaria nigripes]
MARGQRIIRNGDIKIGGRKATPVLVKRDATTGNWTVAPSPEPSSPAPMPTLTPAPPSHPSGSGHHGPPYASKFAVVGGVPTTGTDIPIAAVLLACFAAAAAANMTILQLNKRAGLKFLFSGMMFALCSLRSVALTMRIVWACYPHTGNIAMAAGILTQTGSVLVFIINLIIAQRIIRSYHSAFGWNPAVTVVFRFLVACVVTFLIMAITVSIQTFFTLDEGTRKSDRIVQLFAGTSLAVLAFLPIPTITMASILARGYHVEKFGAGRWRSKLQIVLFTSFLATVGASFRIFTSFAARPVDDPAWYHARVCYYAFNFVVDLVIAVTYLFTRFDRRFIVPNGSKGPGDYGTGMRVRPSSVTSSSSSRARNEKDAEKFSKEKSASDEDGGEKQSLPTDDSKDKGKEKMKSIDIESDDKSAENRSVPRLTLSEIHTYGSVGDWNGMPWPFRTSWAMSRNFGSPRSASRNLNPPDADDGAQDEPQVDDDGNVNDEIADLPRASSGIDEGSSEGSSRWGGETGSSTYIQEPEAVHVHNRRSFQPHQLQGGQKHEWGQALTSDEEIHLSPPKPTPDTVIWPFASETQASGRDPVTRSLSHNNSTAGKSHASSSQTPSRARSNRSQNCPTGQMDIEGVPNIEGGWI